MDAGMREIIEDEISLVDMLQMLFSGWRWVIGGGLAGGLLAWAVLMSQQPLWEATALFKMGQMGQVNQMGQVSSLPIESLPEIITRLKAPRFASEVSYAAGAGKIDQGMIEINPQVKKGSSLLEVKVRAGSSEYARKIAEVVSTRLAERYGELAEGSIHYLNSEMARVHLRIHDLDAIQKELARKAPGTEQGLSQKPEKVFAEYMKLNSLLLVKDGQAQMQHRENELIFLLDKNNTFPTRLVEPVDVSTEPVFPRIRLTLMVGVFSGLMLGMLTALLKGVGIKSRRWGVDS